MQGYPSEKETGEFAKAFKLEAGETRRIHILTAIPYIVRQLFNKSIGPKGKGVNLPDEHARIEGENKKYVFEVYDFTDSTCKPWYAGKEAALKVKADATAYEGIEKMDISIKREGSTFKDTRYFPTTLPTKFHDGLVVGKTRVDLTELTKPTPATELAQFLAIPNPEVEKRAAERELADASPKQRKFVEDLIDRTKVQKSIFAQMLGTVNAPAATDEKFVPEKLTYGQAMRLIDMLKEYEP